MTNLHKQLDSLRASNHLVRNEKLENLWKNSDNFHDAIEVDNTPWRGDDLNLKRNLYWLGLKDTFLPFYNQEMIWQPELLEKNRKKKSITKVKSYRQTHILDFISRGKDWNKTRTPSKINNNCDIFDENSFSSIKNQNTNNPSVKRSVLSLLNRNKLLFEDLEQVPSVERTCTTKRRRKTRIASIDDEEEEKLQEKSKKKKKHFRSKADDEKFAKWVANFNAMCEEVERHQLEIERT